MQDGLRLSVTVPGGALGPEVRKMIGQVRGLLDQPMLTPSEVIAVEYGASAQHVRLMQLVWYQIMRSTYNTRVDNVLLSGQPLALHTPAIQWDGLSPDVSLFTLRRITDFVKEVTLSDGNVLKNPAEQLEYFSRFLIFPGNSDKVYFSAVAGNMELLAHHMEVFLGYVATSLAGTGHYYHLSLPLRPSLKAPPVLNILNPRFLSPYLVISGSSQSIAEPNKRDGP